MVTLRGKLFGWREVKSIFLLSLTILYCYFIITYFKIWTVDSSRKCTYTTVIHERNGKNHTYNRYSPFIFIGGFPRSGTTLLRAMLDVHDDVRCGEETRVIPRILALADKIQNRKKEWNRLLEAGITEKILDNAMANYILQIIVKHGDPAPRICNKDPFTLKYGVYLHGLFPNMKFIFMIRDGRAVVHSLITRKITITEYNLTDYADCLKRWSIRMNDMLKECNELGPSNCLKVKYEELVLHPKSQMERILKYLELPWTGKVLHHDQFINKPDGVSLSKWERSTDQVIKPINLEALAKWVGKIPDDVIENMDIIAPVLKKLGYDPKENPPNYGKPDQEVAANTNNVIRQKKKWKDVAESVLNKSKLESSA